MKSAKPDPLRTASGTVLNRAATVNHPDRDVVAAYVEILQDLAHAKLIDELQRSARANSYGSHDEQIVLVREEILKRMSHYR